MVRLVSLLALAAWVCLASSASAQDSPDAQPAEAPAPSGPVLLPSDYSPAACDPSAAGFRYVEVRGTGFDAWATQHLVGNVVDANGLSQMQWSSVWVSPQGRLTLEVNLCADTFKNRPALPAGNYTVAVGPGTGQTIAATSFALASPPEPAAEGEQTDQPQTMPVPANPTPTLTPAPYVVPNIAPQPTPTPLPAVTLPGGTSSVTLSLPTPTALPQTVGGPGSPQKPFPLGAPGLLADGWQLLVTGITPDAWKGIHDAIPSTIGPATDQHDYEVNVQATFLGQGTGVFSGQRLSLLSGTQTVYDQIHNSCGTVPSMVPPNLATSGGSVRGVVCFIVRISDIDSLVLFDNQTTDADRLYFALK